MTKRILLVSCVIGVLLNSCAVFISDDDDSRHNRSSSGDSDTIIINHISNLSGPLEP